MLRCESAPGGHTAIFIRTTLAFCPPQKVKRRKGNWGIGEKEHTSPLRNRNRNPRINQRLPPRRNHRLLGAVDIIASREGGAPRRGAGGLGELLDEEGGLGLRDGGDCWSGHVVVVVGVGFGSFGDWGSGLGGWFVCGVGGGGGGRGGRLLGHDMMLIQDSMKREGI